MFAHAAQTRRKGKAEGEKPFWISYADLMTAMMVLFLSAMAVTIAAVTLPGATRGEEVSQICSRITQDLHDVDHLEVDCQNNRISFGEAGRFATNSYRLPRDADATLARLVPVILEAADSELGRKWMKQVVVEGYTDSVGGYLYNLHLSLQRSEWVLCLLMDPRKNAQLQLTPEQLQRVRQLFLAGGVSFNNQRDSLDESRRVELRLQFYENEREQRKGDSVLVDTSTDACQL